MTASRCTAMPTSRDSKYDARRMAPTDGSMNIWSSRFAKALDSYKAMIKNQIKPYLATDLCRRWPRRSFKNSITASKRRSCETWQAARHRACRTAWCAVFIWCCTKRWIWRCAYGWLLKTQRSAQRFPKTIIRLNRYSMTNSLSDSCEAHPTGWAVVRFLLHRADHRTAAGWNLRTEVGGLRCGKRKAESEALVAKSGKAADWISAKPKPRRERARSSCRRALRNFCGSEKKRQSADEWIFPNIYEPENRCTPTMLTTD